MNVLSQVIFGRYCPCDNNALVPNCHNANEVYHNYPCLPDVLLCCCWLWCISVSWPVSVTMRAVSGTSIGSLHPLVTGVPSWKSAGKGICHSPALNNNTSQPCSCWCFKCYHWWEETMNFCLQIWLESSEWPHTKLFLALVITIELWLPPRPQLARIYWVMYFNNHKQQPQFKWLLSFSWVFKIDLKLLMVYCCCPTAQILNTNWSSILSFEPPQH